MWLTNNSQLDEFTCAEVCFLYGFWDVCCAAHCFVSLLDFAVDFRVTCGVSVDDWLVIQQCFFACLCFAGRQRLFWFLCSDGFFDFFFTGATKAPSFALHFFCFFPFSWKFVVLNRNFYEEIWRFFSCLFEFSFRGVFVDCKLSGGCALLCFVVRVCVRCCDVMVLLLLR